MIDNKTLDVAITASVEKLQSLFGTAPEVAIVLGSGWAGAVSHVQDAKTLPYTDLSAFPQPKVEGHVNEIVVGNIGKQRVIFLRGRAHTYESGDCTGMAGALRTLKRWGVKLLVQTNASGSLRGHMPPAA
jgi:purine-nucleoside phosphorylase